MPFKVPVFAKERIIAAFLSGDEDFLEVAKILNVNSCTAYTIVAPRATKLLRATGASVILNKPGTAQVGAISKPQKDSKTKTTFSTTGDNKSSQKTKN